MDIKEIERIVTGLQGRLFKNSNSYSTGIFKSQFKGSGLQFKEHQIYNHGDDIRFIDWRQSAKNQKTYVKTFEEERNVEINIVLDITSSLLLGFGKKTKLQAMIELSSLIYLLTGKTQDLTSTYIWGRKTHPILKSNGKQGIIKFISTLNKENLINDEGKFNENYEFHQDINESEKLFWIKSMLVRKKEVILFTDFSNMNLLDEWKQVLGHPLLHVFQILSPLEIMEKNKRHFFAKGSKGNFLGMINTEHESNWEEHKRVTKLLVSEKYLDKFVKEMIKK